MRDDQTASSGQLKRLIGKPQYFALACGSIIGSGWVVVLGDWLKAVSPESKVVAVSGKDRGAINLAGHQGQA